MMVDPGGPPAYRQQPFQPPQQQPYQPPQQAYQPPQQQAYQPPPQQAYQPPAQQGNDLATERKRREEAEAALLSAAERVKVAERRVAELESQLSVAQRSGGGGGGGGDEELNKLRRQVEQMTADMRRMRGGQPVPEPAKAPAIDPQAADAAIALGDALAELRSSLRAASDEATVLTAPQQSVTVVAEALGQATEQLERARSNLRTLGRFLGVA